MILIAHRGLLDGPDKNLENHPDQIKKCQNMGLDVEVDIRCIDDTWWLGHDGPQYKTNLDFLAANSSLWIHAKNTEAAYKLLDYTKRGYNLNFFWHDKDERVLTSHGFWWTDPYSELLPNSIWVLPELSGLDKINYNTLNICYGICTDYAMIMKEKIKNA